MHHLAGFAAPLLRRLHVSNPPLHVGTALEQIGTLLAAILTDPAQLLEREQLHRRWGIVRCQLVELNEETVADRIDDLAGAVMLMIFTIENQ
jgi:hypothetical protein